MSLSSSSDKGRIHVCLCLLIMEVYHFLFYSSLINLVSVIFHDYLSNILKDAIYLNIFSFLYDVCIYQMCS